MASPAPKARQEIQEVPLKIVGGNKFGRYSKISIEQTWNMIVSDESLVDYAGYKNILTLALGSKGRGIYASHVKDILICVVGRQVFSVNENFQKLFIGNLTSTTGDVFIAENNNGQIAITDRQHLYVYNYLAPTSPLLLQSGIGFEVGTFPIKTPGYISFQNTRLLVVDEQTTNWYLSEPNNAISWPNDDAHVGALQTKPDTVQAAVPVPGGANNMLLFGFNVAESWQFTGAALFPYQRLSTSNVDYGCLNASSIAALETYIVWLSANEQSGPTLMIYRAGSIESKSTDGMDFKFSDLKNPTNCTGFLFRQDGHLIYQFTFPDDNLSYAYDFNTDLFFTVTDENLNYHIARNVVYFLNNYYFVSLNDGNLYEFGTQHSNLDYGSGNIQQMPRIRVAPPVRLPSQRMYIVKSLGFTVENGRPNPFVIENHTNATGLTLATEDSQNILTENNIAIGTEGAQTISNTYTTWSENIDLSISRDGGESFGSSERRPMNRVGKRKSRMIFQRLGQANDTSYQIRFVGYGRFVAFDGVLEVYV